MGSLSVCGVVPLAERVIMSDDPAVFEIQSVSMDRSIVCPVLSSNEVSRELAFRWAAILVTLSGEDVVISRNGARMIALPA